VQHAAFLRVRVQTKFYARKQQAAPTKENFKQLNVGLASTVVNPKRDSSLRRPTIWQERDGKKNVGLLRSE